MSPMGVSSVAAPVIPGRVTLNDIRRQILDYIQGADDMDLLDVARRGANLAIYRINSRHWNRLVTYYDVTLGVGTSDYSLPTNFKSPRHCELLDSTGSPQGRLGYKYAKAFFTEHETGGTGSPCIYTTLEDTRTLALDLAPDSNFISRYAYLRLRYHARLPVLVNPADVVDAPSEFCSFIVWYGRADIAATRGTQNAAVWARDQYREAWAHLVADDNDVQTDWEQI